MSLYAGLSPEQALAKWHAIRQKPQDQLTPEEHADIAGNMTGLSKENPAAWTMVRTGTNNTGKTTDLFNPQSGQWDTTQNRGFWSHPESWFQVLAGAGLGGVAAAPAIAGAMGGGAPSAMTGAQMTAGGLVGPGVESAVEKSAPLVSGGSALSEAMKYLAPGLAGAAVIGGLAKGSGSGNTVPLPPELQQMLALQNQRVQSQQPLYDAITKMAMGRLPTNYGGGA